MNGRKLRAQRRRLANSPSGVQSWGFGLRVGYWPCLRACYVQATIAAWHFDVWFGDPADVKVRASQAQRDRVIREELSKAWKALLDEDGEGDEPVLEWLLSPSSFNYAVSCSILDRLAPLTKEEK